MTDKIFLQIESNQIVNGHFTLSQEETHHAKRVLRLNKGKRVWLTDGQGRAYEAEIQSVNGAIAGKINTTHPKFGENLWEMHFAMGIIKKRRMELVVEKITELGVSSISLIRMEKSGQYKTQRHRLKKVILNAAKQSCRSVFPAVFEFTNLNQFLIQNKHHLVAAHVKGVHSISHYLAETRHPVNGVIIGPEGDFSPSELTLLKKHNIHTVSLGQRRLRSETAGIYALSSMNEFYLNQHKI
jgi:16S rRNA (uracil1498-N3)-methyltransferase